MANNEAALQTLIARYQGERPDLPPEVERLNYPEFIKRFAGFLVADIPLLLTVEMVEIENDTTTKVVRLRPFDEESTERASGQVIPPQSTLDARNMVHGTETHDRSVDAYLDAGLFRRGLIRARYKLRMLSITLPLNAEAGKNFPDIVDYQLCDEQVKLVSQV